MHDTVAFLGEANVARNQHLAVLQGNVEKWAADHQQKVGSLEQQGQKDQERVARLEEQLDKVQEEIQKVAVAIPLCQTPTMPVPAQPTGRLSISPLFPTAATKPATLGSAIQGLRAPE